MPEQLARELEPPTPAMIQLSRGLHVQIGLTKSERQLLQFLALARLTGLSIPMWQWILLRFCGRLV